MQITEHRGGQCRLRKFRCDAPANTDPDKVEIKSSPRIPVGGERKPTALSQIGRARRRREESKNVRKKCAGGAKKHSRSHTLSYPSEGELTETI